MIVINKSKLIAALKGIQARSAWCKGVKQYALEMAATTKCGKLTNYYIYGDYGDLTCRGSEMYKRCNAAQKMDDRDIAARLCTPAEYKRYNNLTLRRLSRHDPKISAYYDGRERVINWQLMQEAAILCARDLVTHMLLTVGTEDGRGQVCAKCGCDAQFCGCYAVCYMVLLLDDTAI